WGAGLKATGWPAPIITMKPADELCRSSIGVLIGAGSTRGSNRVGTRLCGNFHFTGDPREAFWLFCDPDRDHSIRRANAGDVAPGPRDVGAGSAARDLHRSLSDGLRHRCGWQAHHLSQRLLRPARPGPTKNHARPMPEVTPDATGHCVAKANGSWVRFGTLQCGVR